MSKAASARLCGINVDLFKQAIESSSAKWHLLTAAKRRQLAESVPGVIPDDFAENAKSRLLDDALRAAMEVIDVDIGGKGRTARLLYQLDIEEVTEDGKKVVVSGYKHADALTREEWVRTLDKMEENVHKHGRSCNASCMLYNKITKQQRWRQRPLPFPEMESES